MASQQSPIDCGEAISYRLLWSNQWLHVSLLQIPKPLIFQWESVQMASPQSPIDCGEGISYRLLWSNQWLHSSLLVRHRRPTPPAGPSFKAISYRMLWSNVLLIAVKHAMASQQPPADSKTIYISVGKCMNGFTATSYRLLRSNLL